MITKTYALDYYVISTWGAGVLLSRFADFIPYFSFPVFLGINKQKKEFGESVKNTDEPSKFFTMDNRDRFSGWSHAKKTGHANEDMITTYVKENKEIQSKLLLCAGKEGKITDVLEGGLQEKGVESVLGDKTKSKPDIRLKLHNDQFVNISIKKSPAGQVFLITPERFIDGFNEQFHKKIPEKVQEAILLYFGKHKDTSRIIEEYSNKLTKNYELRKGRVVKSTLDKYQPRLCEDLLDWFKNNIVDIFEFCFVRGLVKDNSNWTDVLWYKNLLMGEDDCDKIFAIKTLKDKISQRTDLVSFGKKHGGSTIQLPFGFLQYHNPQKKIPSGNSMQFHHKLDSLMSL